MNSRDRRIDSLRGVSIFLVLLHHFHLAYNLGPGLLYRNGNYGVIIFFVISGYLITSTSLRRFGTLQNVSLRGFYAFRFARIYPCLVLVLAIITLLGLAGMHYFTSRPQISFFIADLSVLTFWHNVLMAHTGYFNYGLNILWSLSVEEVFYLLFPMLCLLLRSNWWIASVWVAAILYSPLFRSQHSTDEIQYLYANLSCFDAIAMGCCTALLARDGHLSKEVRNLLQLAAVVAMTAVFAYAAIGSNVIWGPTLMAFSAVFFLGAESSSRDERRSSLELVGWFRSGWFRSGWFGFEWLGRHSYELYLFHIVILAALRNLLDRDALPEAARWPWFALYLGLSAITAWAIARWYSNPLNYRLRNLLA